MSVGCSVHQSAKFTLNLSLTKLPTFPSAYGEYIYSITHW